TTQTPLQIGELVRGDKIGGALVEFGLVLPAAERCRKAADRHFNFSTITGAVPERDFYPRWERALGFVDRVATDPREEGANLVAHDRRLFEIGQRTAAVQRYCSQRVFQR